MKWQHAPQNVTTSMIPAVEVNGNLLYVDNGQVKRLSHVNGEVLAVSSVENLPLWSTVLATRDSLVHISNGGNAYMALSHDLQHVLWTETNSGNNTCALPNLSYNGTMIMAGNGTVIKAFRNNDLHPPVAEFVASAYSIYIGQSIEFSDFSSCQPTSWEWTFEGGSPATSTEQNPVVTYNQPDHYSVSLAVHNALGSDTHHSLSTLRPLLKGFAQLVHIRYQDQFFRGVQLSSRIIKLRNQHIINQLNPF